MNTMKSALPVLLLLPPLLAACSPTELNCEEGSEDEILLYEDADQDGYPSNTTTSIDSICRGNEIPVGEATNENGVDCDDNDAEVFSEEANTTLGVDHDCAIISRPISSPSIQSTTTQSDNEESESKHFQVKGSIPTKWTVRSAQATDDAEAACGDDSVHTIYVTNSDGLLAKGAVTSLSEAIALAEERSAITTICIDNAASPYYTNAKIDGSRLVQPLTIHGVCASMSACTLDGKANGSVITITNNAVVTLENLIIQNGEAEGDGGGLNISSSTVSIYNTKLSQHEAGSSGGAIYASEGSILTLRDVTLSDNESQTGGGIALSESELAAYSLSTSYNHASSRGGAIAAQDDSYIAVNGLRSNADAADSYGGAIYCGKSTGAVQHSTISKATSRYGGAIYLSECGTDDPFEVSATVLLHNVAGYGGAIYLSNESTIEVSRSALLRNTAEVLTSIPDKVFGPPEKEDIASYDAFHIPVGVSAYTHARYASPSNLVPSSSAPIDGTYSTHSAAPAQKARSATSVGGEGGAVYLSSSAQLRMTHSTLVGNLSEAGGTVDALGDASIESSIFVDNSPENAVVEGVGWESCALDSSVVVGNVPGDGSSQTPSNDCAESRVLDDQTPPFQNYNSTDSICDERSWNLSPSDATDHYPYGAYSTVGGALNPPSAGTVAANSMSTMERIECNNWIILELNLSKGIELSL